MPRKCDITRRKDLTEKCVIALCLSLLVCMGFHHWKDMLAVASGPAGCTQMPAFTVHAEVGVADTEDNLPSKTRRTGASSTSHTTATTKPPATDPK